MRSCPERHRARHAAAAACALALLASGWGCAAPRLLYDGPPLPREQVALLRGMPDFHATAGRDGARNPVAARGTVVVIGLDGKVFNPKVHAAYSGDSFLLLPGRHELLAYCEYAPNDGSTAKVLYSELFNLAFTARAGGEYRIQASFSSGPGGAGRLAGQLGVWARPGVWDVTGTHTVRPSALVSGEFPSVPVRHRTLAHIQAAVARL